MNVSRIGIFGLIWPNLQEEEEITTLAKIDVTPIFDKEKTILPVFDTVKGSVPAKEIIKTFGDQ